MDKNILNENVFPSERYTTDLKQHVTPTQIDKQISLKNKRDMLLSKRKVAIQNDS